MLYIELDITTGSRLALSKALNLNPPSDGQLALEARASNLDALLLAARLHCLSNVSDTPNTSCRGSCRLPDKRYIFPIGALLSFLHAG